MTFIDAYIPYGTAWSTPFCKWQGALSTSHPLELAARSAKAALERARVPVESLDALVLGWTVPSPSSFYGAPWVAGLIGATGVTGPMVSQACATGARAIATAASLVDAQQPSVLVITADRCSNGPHLYYPDPNGPGGKGRAEDWVFDNFGKDPWAKNSMLATAENVAREAGITRAEQDEMTLLRCSQYADALANDRAFQRRYFLPVDVMDPRGKKVVARVESDEGVFPTTREGLARLEPLLPEGTVTFGGQTHPADGNAGLLVTTESRARELAKDGIVIRLVAYAEARTKKGFMAMAVVPAARRLLEVTGWKASDVHMKTHNPFAVNDVYLSRELKLPADSFNRFGSSLVFGHPQAPTGTRLVAELIEELVLAGGGRGLFVGCAAGDTAAGLALEVQVP